MNFRKAKKEIAKAKGITEKEALKQLVEDDLKTMTEAEDKFKMLEEPSKKKRQEAPKGAFKKTFDSF